MKEDENINLEYLKKATETALGTPHHVPTSYFDALNWDTIKKNKEIDTTEISGRLNTPPPTYFADVNENIFKKVHHRPRVIMWRKLAVAASLLVVVSSLIYYSIKNKASQDFSDVTFTQISTHQLSDFIDTDSTNSANNTGKTQASFDLNQSFQTISNEELANFLTETDDKNDNF